MKICAFMDCQYIVIHGFKLARYLGSESIPTRFACPVSKQNPKTSVPYFLLIVSILIAIFLASQHGPSTIWFPILVLSFETAPVLTAFPNTMKADTLGFIANIGKYFSGALDE